MQVPPRSFHTKIIPEIFHRLADLLGILISMNGKIYKISATIFLDDDLFIFAEKIEIDEIGDKKGE